MTVIKKPVTAIVLEENRTYDETTTAIVSAAVSNDDLIEGDTVTFQMLQLRILQRQIYQ